MIHTDPSAPGATFADFRQSQLAAEIRQSAHRLHQSVNQFYDGDRPYGFHLDMVADGVAQFAGDMNIPAEDYAAVWFGAYYHDSIEDARMTYNNVLEAAGRFMPRDKALMATEIVYALTNEKGRTRAERADSRYYAGIRSTPYAPFVKMADRLANITYSGQHSQGTNLKMKEIYARELPHFIEAVAAPSEPCSDFRLKVPAAMIAACKGH